MRCEVRGTLCGAVEVRVDAPGGPVVGRISCEPSVDWHEVAAPIEMPAGDHAAYLSIEGEGSSISRHSVLNDEFGDKCEFDSQTREK